MARWLATIGLGLTLAGAIILFVFTPVAAQTGGPARYGTPGQAQQNVLTVQRQTRWVRLGFGLIVIGTALQGLAVWVA